MDDPQHMEGSQAPPDLNEFSEFLRSAAEDAVTISVVYNGGSRAGAARDVLPIAVTETELVVEEPGSRLRKHYKLNLIPSATRRDGSSVTNEGAAIPQSLAIPRFGTVAEYAEHFATELHAAGWNVVVADDCIVLQVLRCFKNGKPKSPLIHVCVGYAEPTGVSVLDVFSDSAEAQFVQMPLTGRELPWRVNCRRRAQGRSFREIHSAMVAFIEDARASAPSDP